MVSDRAPLDRANMGVLLHSSVAILIDTARFEQAHERPSSRTAERIYLTQDFNSHPLPSKAIERIKDQYTTIKKSMTSVSTCFKNHFTPLENFPHTLSVYTRWLRLSEQNF